MGTRLVGALAFITFIHFGARAAAPATAVTVSDLPTPSALPSTLDHLTDPAVGCSLLVVFDPTCPACARASALQAEQPDLPLDVVWVAENEEAKEHYAGRVHPDARVVVAPTAAETLQVRAVPAAFLVSEGTVLYGATISGTEDLGRVAAQCTSAADA